jgi:hypothetical protein
MPTSNPTPSDVHVNQPLTNISIAYMQDVTEFIATQVFPNVPVAKNSDVYFMFPKGEWFRTEARERPLGSESAGTRFGVDKSPAYNATVKALHVDVDDQLRANQDSPLDLDSASAELVTRGLLLRREKDFADKFFTTGVWTGSSTGGDITPSTKWDASNSTPIKDIRTEMRSLKTKTGFRPNKLILGEDVWDAIQDNGDFLDRISIGRDKVVTLDLLATVLGLPPGSVLIAGAIQNVAIEGAPSGDDLRFLFEDAALLVYAAQRPSLMMPSAGYTFSWTGYLGASADGLRMLRFRMQHLRSDRIEGEMAYDLNLVASDLGVFFEDVLT